MRTLLSIVLGTALAACSGEPAAPPPSEDAVATPTPATTPAPTAEPVVEAPATPTATGSLRVDLPAAGTIGFAGFGPARFGGSAEDVRIAWGGDLGDAKPDVPGGCHYLIPQPLGRDGYKIAFMIEHDRLARIDVNNPTTPAPGGGKSGMSKAEIAGLYPAIEARPHAYSDGQYLRIKDPAGGNGVLVFETDGTGDQAKVTDWRIGLPPQVDYVEGCS